MKIKTENIQIEFDSALIDISPLIIRRAIYKIDEGNAEATQELQFQVRNIKNVNLCHLEVEFEYSSSNNEFEGFDSDLRLEPLRPSESHNFSLIIDPPKEYSKATLKIKIRKQTLGDKIPSYVSWLFIGLFFITFLYSKFT